MGGVFSSANSGGIDCFLLPYGGAAAEGTIRCSISGPVSAYYEFPAGVSRFTVTQLTSGNGGQVLASDGSTLFAGGRGAQLASPITVDIPSPEQGGYRLPFYLSDNGASPDPASSAPGYTTFFGPPLGGNGYAGPAGGGPSYLPSLGIYLGGGGGAGSCGAGGDAGAGPLANIYYAGQNAAKGTCLGRPASGARPASNSGGKGGLSDGIVGQTGQANGQGGNAVSDNVNVQTGGGGGGITGAGGGGATGFGGGAGNTVCQVSGCSTTQRAAGDTALPTLVFEFLAPGTYITQTVPKQFNTEVTSTMTETVLELQTSTEVLLSTTQDPTSSVSTTVSSTQTLTINAGRTKAVDVVTSTQTPTATQTIVTSSILPGNCVTSEAVYPASCCPAQWLPLQPISSGSPSRRVRRKVLNRRLDLQKRQGSSSEEIQMPTFGPFSIDPNFQEFYVYTTSITFTDGVLDYAQTVVTSYTPTITVSSLVSLPAETTTLVSSDLSTVTTRADAATTATVVRVVNASPTTAATVTRTVTSEGTACPTQLALSAPQCPTQTGGGVDTNYQRAQTAELKRLKQRNNGAPVIVNCGSAGTYSY